MKRALLIDCCIRKDRSRTAKLAEAFVKPSGDAVRAERYKADFTYYRDGIFVVEDVKGYRTQDYINKRKAMYEKYGIEVTEI